MLASHWAGIVILCQCAQFWTDRFSWYLGSSSQHFKVQLPFYRYDKNLTHLDKVTKEIHFLICLYVGSGDPTQGVKLAQRALLPARPSLQP